MPKLFTIGFTKRSAQQFFGILQDNAVTLVSDVRLNNHGQLAGYTKAKDLEFFLKLVGIDYQYWKSFAPTKEIRDTYHLNKNFRQYEMSYRELLMERNALETIPAGVFDAMAVCLLCSEPTADRCHRRLAAEYIATAYPNLTIVHL